MAVKKDKQTEEKILDAARSVFMQRGFFGARMQDIADQAGINKAMLHYYFRSKDKMFESIFTEAMDKFFGEVLIILNKDLPLEAKIEYFIEKYIDVFVDMEYLPGFIIHEITHNRERIEQFTKEKFKFDPYIFIGQIQQEMQNGKVVQVDPRHIIVNMLSLCIFPFAAKPLLMLKMNFSEEEFSQFIEDRKKLLPELILHGILKK